MSFRACVVAVAPLRAEALHKSEMISQLIFGECVKILDDTKDFYKVISLYDNYEGWCAKNQLSIVDEYFYLNNHLQIITSPLITTTLNAEKIYLSAGSFVGCTNNNLLNIGDNKIVFENFAEFTASIQLKDSLKAYLNIPYLWGGKTVFGIDCSGFAQLIYKLLGIKLNRDAYQQAEQGEIVGFLQEAKLGDLAFFDNEEGRITHVGILLNEQQIIHASGMVRIDKIDNAGIINTTTQKRTHQLRIIKRMVF